MIPRPSLKLAMLAGMAGFLVALAGHRGERRARSLAALQGVEWFLSAGGAALLTGAIRRALEVREVEVMERFTRVDEAVIERDPDRSRR